jgi:hypothetical protein
MTTREGRKVLAVVPAASRRFVSVTFNRGRYLGGVTTEDVRRTAAVYVEEDAR